MLHPLICRFCLLTFTSTSSSAMYSSYIYISFLDFIPLSSPTPLSFLMCIVYTKGGCMYRYYALFNMSTRIASTLCFSLPTFHMQDIPLTLSGTAVRGRGSGGEEGWQIARHHAVSECSQPMQPHPAHPRRLQAPTIYYTIVASTGRLCGTLMAMT